MLKTVCLNMIVKNEKSVIRRCLESVKDFIDYWVIVDTGSTDGTQKVIRECLSDIPGELYERPWVDFSHNRNEALDLAQGKGDYFLFIDADDKLVFSKDYVRPDLIRDSYLVNYYRNSCITHRIFLVNSKLHWRWEGVVHESIECPEKKEIELYIGAYIESSTEGARSQDPDKYIKDIQLLEEVLKTDPDNARVVFHIAVFSEDLKDYPKALKYFEMRAAMGGWDQEVFYSLFRAAAMKEALNYDPQIFLSDYQAAYDFRPSRVEPLFSLALYYMNLQDYKKAYSILKRAVLIPCSLDSIYVITKIYDFGILVSLADCAYHLGKFHETLSLYNKLLQNPRIPKELRDAIEKYLPRVKLNASKMLLNVIDPIFP